MATKGKQVQFTVYLPPELARGLKLLSDRTHVPQTEYLRQGVKEMLRKYAGHEREAVKKKEGK